MASNEESNAIGGDEKHIFCQTSINNKRPQLKLTINNNIITSLVDTGADMTIRTQNSWPQRWPLREVNVQCTTFRDWNSI